jgi:hypothetical protein
LHTDENCVADKDLLREGWKMKAYEISEVTG